MFTLTCLLYRNGGDPWLILGYPKLNLRLTPAEAPAAVGQELYVKIRHNYTNNGLIHTRLRAARRLVKCAAGQPPQLTRRQNNERKIVTDGPRGRGRHDGSCRGRGA